MRKSIDKRVDIKQKTTDIFFLIDIRDCPLQVRFLNWKIILISLILLLNQDVFAGNLFPSTLLCEMQVNPVGIESPNPSLSWKLSSSKRSQFQSAYQVVVSDDPELLKSDIGNCWNSGKITSSQSLHIQYSGKKLRPAKKYFWKVRVWSNDKDSSEWSNPASWQMGLPHQSDWKSAAWIGMDRLESTQRFNYGVPFTFEGQRKKVDNFPVNTKALPVFRKEFTAHKQIKSATAFVCGLGHFELFINGKKADNHFLDPGWTNYNQSAIYVSFDITNLLQNSQNALGIMLGNGFYFIPNAPERYKPLAIAFGYPSLRAKFIINYTDNTTDEIVTDKSWKTAEGPVRFTSLFGGEEYDATKELPGWMYAGYNDKGWNYAQEVDGPPQLASQQSNHLSINQTLNAQKISHPEKGAWVYDFGQNASAIPYIKVSGKKGSVVKLIPGELLDSNGLVTQKAVGEPVYFTYTLKGDSVESWHPQFTYYGYRYIQVEGAVPKDETNELQLPFLLDIKSLHTGNSAATIGSFHCSNSLFNDIFKLIDWSVKSNMASVLTDCPTREKTGWLEVSYLMGNSIMYNYEAYLFYKKIIDDIRESQYPNGRFTDYAPEYYTMHRFSDFPEWGSAGIILPWYLYKQYGDKQILQDVYLPTRRYVEYLRNKTKENILELGIGDWFDIGPGPVGPSQLTPMGLTATATYYYDVNILMEMARLLNFTTDFAIYHKLAADIKTAFNKKYFNPQTKQYATGSQSANSMAIFMNLADSVYEKEILQNIVIDIASRNYSLTSGDIGYRYLLKVLSEENESEVIFKMNNRSDVPGYGYQLAKGATALTESWQAFTNVSNNHCMLGHLMEWFYSGLCGINQTDSSVAFKEIIINPQPVDSISFANASYNSPYGIIKSGWKKDAGKFELNVEIPANTTATIFIPAKNIDAITENGYSVKNQNQFQYSGYKDGKVMIKTGSGTYRFRVE